MRRGLRICGVPACVIAAVVCASASAAPALSIQVLSNRADLISGGDALVSVVVPSGISPDAVHVRIGKRDVTGAFEKRGDGRLEGLVKDMAAGPNVLTACAAKA